MNVWDNNNNYHYAPYVSKYLVNNKVPFTICEVSKKETGGITYGYKYVFLNKSVFDTGYPFSAEMTVFHELIHVMGYGEFGAWAACLAAGYVSEDELYNNFISDALASKQYYTSLGYKDTGGEILANNFDSRGKFFGKKGEFMNSVYLYGCKIIGKK